MNGRMEIRSSEVRIFLAGCLSVAILWTLAAGFTSGAWPQWTTPREKLRGVLSRQSLAPPLHSANAMLHYSRDGRYLSLQDSAGVFLLLRNPLKLLGYIEAPNSYAARFSADSESIILLSLGLTYERWPVKPGQILENKVLPIPDGCVDAELAPGGDLLACYRPDFSLGVLQLSSGEWIFSSQIQDTGSHTTIFAIPLNLDAPFAGPFGFTLSHDMELLANRGISRLPMAFSPDGTTLLAGDTQNAVRVDTLGRKKTNLPGAILKLMSGTMVVEDEARVLLMPRGRPAEPAIRSLRDGNVLATPNFKADSVALATDARYALLYDTDGGGARVFDLEENRAVETPENIAADSFAGELALATENGELSLVRKGEQTPFASVVLPAEGFSTLRSAGVTPDLEKIAIAGDGEAGLFQIVTGRLLANLKEFSAVNFTDSSAALLLTPERRRERTAAVEYLIDRVDAQGAVHASAKGREATLATVPQTMWRLEGPPTKPLAIWSSGERLLQAGGPVLFEYSFESLAGHGMFLPRADGVSFRRGARLLEGTGVPFRLRTLDPASGKELWSRTFSGLPPIPFADPQGDRLVLSWPAKSAGAWAAAKQNAAAKEAVKKAKLTDQDAFLEAVDARTGKFLGGVLVQSGNSPANFDYIFSVGDAIIFSRDAVRVHVCSMQDGEVKAKLVGIGASANAQSKLLALNTGSGHLAIFDLDTTAKVDEEIFSERIVYTHFSADGRRLLVLTEGQRVFVMDMSGVRK